MYLNELLKNVDVVETRGDGNPDILSVHYNSTTVTEGGLFVAIEGFETDGHKYVHDAVRRGARAIVCTRFTDDTDVLQIRVSDSRLEEAKISSNFFGNPSERFRLIGVTGTNGKTTVTYLVKHILDKLGYKTGLIGTNQNIIGDRIIETGRTTPDSFELQKLFCEMAEERVDYVIMEVSSHALELSRVYGCIFEVGAFTNLTQDHLDFHKTMDAYASAKAKLFDISRNAVINSDDSYGRKMAESCPCPCMSYGKASLAELRAENISLGQNGVSFTADSVDYSLAIPGDFSVYNALCAVGIALSLGIDAKKIKTALADAKGVKGRAEVVDTGDSDYTVMIDYAHTPDGVENILKTARGFANGRVVVLFGCGGDRDTTKRPIMGRVAGELADFCIVTSDNPRTENPSDIIAMIEEGVKETGVEYVVIENRYEAIKYALTNAQSGDVIILAGKGHETYQILNSGTIHFDEREVIREILGLEE
ncbi:MAG: UDP-N-acetylmuramoyl-L-alanyl-D-glutamate--2,6-diaminopimelate ligase [Clostridia bacterium]|nr:UDP-N-acetylmuramoyl-L-alanyl-D-glutamate--2,6-diaminopimelate ligase [Clostridia bacterium]